MKLTIDRATLLRALEPTRRVAEAKSTIPILSHALLSAQAGGLVLRATDLDIESRVTVEARVETCGDLAVSAATLHDLVRKLPEKAEVSLFLEGDQLHMRSGRSRFKLSTLSAQDWPDIPDLDYPAEFELPAKTLARLLAKTSFAISTEETRYYLNGVFFHHTTNDDGPALRMVATDGHRLARMETAAPSGAAPMPGVIVPSKACAEVERLLKSAEGDIGVAVSRTKIRFAIGATVLSSKLIDGTFPDYARVIPANNPTRAEVDRAELAAAADRVSTISSERGRAVKLSFGDDRLALCVVNPDHGEASDEVEASYQAPPMEIGFNSRYLAEVLAALDGDRAIIRLADAGSPTIFQSATQNDLLVVLMPMRV